MTELVIGIDISALAICGVLLFACAFEIKINPKLKNHVLALIVAHLAAMTVDLVSWLCEGKPELSLVLFISNFLIFTLAFGEVFLFFYVYFKFLSLKVKVSNIFVIVPFVLSVVAEIITTVFSLNGQFFHVENGKYTEGPMVWLYFVMIIILIAYLFVFVFANIKQMGVHDTIAFAAYPIMPLLGVVIDMLVDSFSFTYSIAAIPIFIFYIMILGEEQKKSTSREEALFNRFRTDELTGVLNRNAYSAALSECVPDRTYGVVFSDVNGLKYTNDNMSHSAGDDLLMRAGALLKKCFPDNSVFRISGDEFVVIFSCDSKADLKSYTELLRREIEEESYPILAFGRAFGEGKDIRKLISVAEDKMYIDKTGFHKMFPQYVRMGSLFKKTEKPADDAVPSTGANSFAEKSKGAKVLVVDDSEITRELLGELLIGTYDVIYAENGREAIDYISAHPNDISIIFLDLIMPVLDGKEFMKFRKDDLNLKNIPVIVTTSVADEEIINECFELGATDVMHKPYSADLLLSRTKEIIEKGILTESENDYDELTGVLTKKAFFKRAEIMLKANPDKHFDMVISDIQNFKLINQRYGYEMGDKVLRHVGEYLTLNADDSVLTGRYSGDQFLSIFEHRDDLTNGFLKEMLSKIAETGPIKNITGKFGVYDNIDRTKRVSYLCDCCLAALRSVKHKYGKTYGVFDEKLQKKNEKESRIENDMQFAYDNNCFDVYFQPKHDAKTNKLIGAEALIRWTHPEYGPLSPAEFIPIFERSEFIARADFYVWNKVCKNLRKWIDMGIDVVPISVNSSKKDYVYKDYLSLIEKPVNEYGIDRKYLHIEVTESIFSENPQQMMDNLNALRGRGYEIELDDFGSGYSSLHLMGDMPLDVVKFDMSLVSKIHDEKKNKILSACISLAKDFGYKTIAEGVEREDQHIAVANMGCDGIQGYHYSKPLPEDEFEDYMIKCAGGFIKHEEM